MVFTKIIFWIGLIIIFYNYIGYALLAWLLLQFRKGVKSTEIPKAYVPGVSFIVAAYNEENCIEEKVKNSLEQKYPPEKIEFLFITDGSTDSTNKIISRYPEIQLLFQPERLGKSAALNRVVTFASKEILIFSDSNTILNREATYNITRHYFNDIIGGVAGEKKVISPIDKSNDEVGQTEGFYWKYESFLKKIDSDYYSVVGAAGELFSLRKELFEPVDNDTILDDFIISMRVAQKGYKIKYEPKAFAIELPSQSLKEEQKRKIRISAGGFQSIKKLSSLLLFWRQPKLSFLYISHRVLRWTLSPISLIAVMISNIIITIYSHSTFFNVFLLCQTLFYFLALLTPLINKSSKNKFLKILKIPSYFLFMNLSVIQGFLRYIQKKQSATWEKAKRL